jgi:hypothetical protein
MRTIVLTVLCAAAIGFSTPTPGWSQPAAVAPPAGDADTPHFSKARFGVAARVKKPKVDWGVSVDGAKRNANWFREMRDPCQVEG